MVPASCHLNHCILSVCLSMALANTVYCQFRDDFSTDNPSADQSAWRSFTGDGNATIRFSRVDGVGRVVVDATEDEQNVWWAVIQRPVADALDRELLARPDYELRMEARVRSSHAPRRINLSFHTNRTTDFHSHLMEYDLGEANRWHTVSLTTQGFDIQASDSINAQLALIDWGTSKYTLEIDYLSVDVARADDAPPDLGNPIPYHPPAPDPESFSHHRHPTSDAMLDSSFPDTNFSDWQSSGTANTLSVGGSRFVLLQWDFSDLQNRVAAGPGVLEMTSLHCEQKAETIENFGLVRVSEILRRDRKWVEDTVTYSNFLAGRPMAEAINPQMIIDQSIPLEPNSKNRWVISQPALQRLLSGESAGIALLPLGALHAAFHSRESQKTEYKPTLRFNLEAED